MMRIFFLSIFMICWMQLFAQHQLGIIVGQKDLRKKDHLAIRGFVISKDTTVVSAVNLDSNFLQVDVPVKPGKVSYELEVMLTRDNILYTSHVSGDYVAEYDTFLMVPSPTEVVTADHVIEVENVTFTTHSFLPGGYDRKKLYPHIIFLTWENDLLQYEKSWWQETMSKNKTDVILTRVNLKVTDSVSINRITSLVSDTLSDYVRSKFRVLPGKDNFIISGEGAGATIALATILDHELIFGRSGMFLPLFEGLPEEASMSVKKHAASANGMFFFYTGSQPNEVDRKTSARIMDELGAGSRSLIYAVEDENGAATPGDWKRWFPEFYKWVFSNGLNYIIR